MKQKNALFILSNGRVASINKKDGSIIWEIKLKEYGVSNMTHGVGQINIEADKIYIGYSGILLCLNIKDGSLVWKNELKGWGYNFISMANVNGDAEAALMTARTAAAAAGAA